MQGDAEPHKPPAVDDYPARQGAGETRAELYFDLTHLGAGSQR